MGLRIRLGALLGERPTILALGYFHCPSLCGVVRDDLLEALSHAGSRAGADYGLCGHGIDPAETAADAAAALADDRERYPAAAAERGWHFAHRRCRERSRRSNGAVGFRSRYDVHLRQFLHPAGLVVLTPDGASRAMCSASAIRPATSAAAVTLASSGGIAKAALPILLLCFHFDATTGRYSLEIMKVLRLAAS